MEWHCFKDYRRMVEVDLELENLEDHHKFFSQRTKMSALRPRLYNVGLVLF